MKNPEHNINVSTESVVNPLKSCSESSNLTVGPRGKKSGTQTIHPQGITNVSHTFAVIIH